MGNKTSPELFSELSELIAELDIKSTTAAKAIHRLKESDTPPDLKGVLEMVLEKVQHIRGLVEPMSGYSRELFIRSVTDGLTKLKNRSYFEEVIKKKIEEIDDASCIMVDIDHFGRYNNTYGHQQGDKALQLTAQVIEASAPTEFIARYGGEEFSIMLAGYSQLNGNTKDAAEKIRRNVEQSIVPAFSSEVMGIEKLLQLLGDGECHNAICRRAKRFLDTDDMIEGDYEAELKRQFILRAFKEELEDKDIDRRAFSRKLQKVRKYLHGIQRLTVSVGAAVRKKGESVESLIYHADRALYRAKELGRNQVFIL